MKRIVQCQKCQTKFSVFDMGKTVTKRCPKCGESVVIEPEQAKSGDAPATPPPAAEAKPEVPDVKATEPKTEAKADAKAEPLPETKPEAKPEPKAETKTDAKSDVKTEPKTEAKPEVKAEAKPDVKAEVKTEAKPDAKADAKTETKPETKAEVKADVKSDAKPDAKSDAKPDAKTDAKADAKAEPKSDAKPETKGAPAPKEIAVKKPTSKPAASTPLPSAAPAETLTPNMSHGDCGISFGEVVIIMALLVFSLILQVIGIRKAASRFNYLDQQVQSIQSQLNALKR